MADLSQLRPRIEALELKRSTLVSLLDNPDLGTLHVDVTQAIEELDDLIEEFKRTFEF
ncbi:MAG: hypothetical protein NT070_21505 [Cyanobacteria bacterium]|nr:hypothetical protein [Cyanobacteriota bacterium]